jgi:hypothetical protein
MLGSNITLTNMSISSTEYIEPPTPNDKLNLEPVTSPFRKKSRTIFGSSVNDSKEDEE